MFPHSLFFVKHCLRLLNKTLCFYGSPILKVFRVGFYAKSNQGVGLLCKPEYHWDILSNINFNVYYSDYDK